MAVSWLRIRPVMVIVCSLLLPMTYLSCTLLAKYAVFGGIQRPGADMDVPKFDRWAVPAHVPPRLPNAGVVTYPPRATLGPRLQPDYQLVLVHTGSARVTVNGKPQEIPAGHVGLLLPGTTEYFASRPTGRHAIAVSPRRSHPSTAS